MKNIKAIQKTAFPGRIKDLYLDPTEFVNDEGVLTMIDGQPLFHTIQQALLYGSVMGLEGYHARMYQGRIGYMAGENADFPT